MAAESSRWLADAKGADIKVAENEMTDFKVADNWPRSKSTERFFGMPSKFYYT